MVNKRFFCKVCEEFDCDCLSSECYKIYDLKEMIEWVKEESGLLNKRRERKNG